MPHQMPGTTLDKLLIILPNWVGDVVMATPMLRAIRAQYPSAQITYLMKPYVQDVLRGAPWFDDIALWPARGRNPLALWGCARALRRANFDGILLMTNSFRTALVAWLIGARRRIGYARDYRSWLLTEPLPVPCDNGRRRVESMLTYYGRFARHLNCPEPTPELELFTDEDSAATVEGWWREFGLDDGRPIVVLNPGGRFGASKIYPAERFAAAAHALQSRHGAHIIVTGGPQDQPMVDAVAAHMTRPPLTLLPPRQDLRRLKSVIARANLLITNDTGPRHFAIALDTPVVTIFGPTHPGWTESHYPHERKVLVEIDCGPCQKPVCPLGHRNCLMNINPDMVVAAADELLEQPGTPQPS